LAVTRVHQYRRLLLPCSRRARTQVLGVSSV